MPVIRLTDPALGVRSITAQLSSSKPGSAHTGEPLTQGESPGENFHGPVSATAELPRVTTCAGAPAAICTVPDAQTDNRTSSEDKLIARMTARLPLAPIQSDDGLKRLRRYVPTRSEVRITGPLTANNSSIFCLSERHAYHPQMATPLHPASGISPPISLLSSADPNALQSQRRATCRMRSVSSHRRNAWVRLCPKAHDEGYRPRQFSRKRVASLHLIRRRRPHRCRGI
jgi:hypothetical protein